MQLPRTRYSALLLKCMEGHCRQRTWNSCFHSVDSDSFTMRTTVITTGWKKFQAAWLASQSFQQLHTECSSPRKYFFALVWSHPAYAILCLTHTHAAEVLIYWSICYCSSKFTEKIGSFIQSFCDHIIENYIVMCTYCMHVALIPTFCNFVALQICFNRKQFSSKGIRCIHPYYVSWIPYSAKIQFSKQRPMFKSH